MPDYTILLIDYDPRSIHKLQNALEGAGYRVEVAKDGEAGIQAFGELRPDLTLVEAMIPKVHGFEVCRRLKQTDHGKESPVLIVTAVYRGRKYRFEARDHYGCDGYLEKPITDEELVGAVRSFLPVRDEATSASSPIEEEILSELDAILPDDPSKAALPRRPHADAKPEV